MWRVSESAGELTLHASTWIGLLIVAAGIALAVFVARGGAKGKVFGMSAVILIVFLSGWTLLFASTRLDESGVRVRTALGVQASATWGEITSVAVEERKVSRGNHTYLVLYRADGTDVAVRISHLEAEDAVRVIEFAKARAGKGR